MNKYIIVTIGDINGIGIELLINLWKEKKINYFILLTNKKIFINYLKKNNIKIDIIKINENLKDIDIYKKNDFLIYDYKVKSNIQNTYKSLSEAYKLVKRNKFKGIVTLPINKDLIITNINKKFKGQTEYFQKKDNKKISNMIFIHNKLIVTTLTNHIKLKDICANLNKKEYLYNKLKNLNKTLKKDFNLINPKILISGINPHAGENGKIGKEEIILLHPIIKKMKKYNMNIEGPISADSIFIKYNINKYQCFIFNYHDQALIPFKILSKFEGVNYTGGLSIIRTSPVHGTAYDLVGKKVANYDSLKNCFSYINKISKLRNKIVNS